METTKYCPKCKQDKLVEQYGKNRARSERDGLDSYCKQCNTERHKLRYKSDNREVYFKQLRSKPSYRSRQNERRRERWSTDLNFRLGNNLRTRLYIAVRNCQRTGSAVKDLGCSIYEFKLYIQNQFRDGMSWDNWGKVWHLDHVMPMCQFDLSERQQILEACNYLNIQPLFIFENMSKGGR